MTCLVRSRGFSLAELLLAMLLLAVVVLTVLGLTTTLLKSGQKSVDTTTAAAVAAQELQRVIDIGQTDPAFWTGDHVATPYRTTTVRVDRTDFECVVYAATVREGAQEVGTSTGRADNRLKKVDIVVTWWNSDEQDHQGYGRLQLRQSRLVAQRLE